MVAAAQHLFHTVVQCQPLIKLERPVSRLLARGTLACIISVRDPSLHPVAISCHNAVEACHGPGGVQPEGAEGEPHLVEVAAARAGAIVGNGDGDG